MSKRRLLVIAHHHPELLRGGAQQAAYELFKGFERLPDYEAFFLAGVQHYMQPQLVKQGAHIYGHDGRPNEFLNVGYDFDYFWQRNTAAFVNGWDFFVDFIRALAPDIVHFNHTLHLGIEMIRAVKVAAPQARIVYTLHEFIPICHADGQMIRPTDRSLCDRASPSRCALCFPDIGPEKFFLREKWIKAHFAEVDRFVVPSEFLRRRYVEWGIPEREIVLIDYGRMFDRASVGEEPARPRRNRFGFFGQIIDNKGVACLIEAVRRLIRRGREDFELRIHGSNLSFASETLRSEFAEAVASIRQIQHAGSYDNRELARLARPLDWIVVPSVWWENSPLVIQEAFLCKRPVICSNIGGMAEKVADEVNGLHFAVGNPEALADAMERAMSEPGLWDRLREGIPPILAVEEAVELHRRHCFENALHGPTLRAIAGDAEIAPKPRRARRSAGAP